MTALARSRDHRTRSEDEVRCGGGRSARSDGPPAGSLPEGPSQHRMPDRQAVREVPAPDWNGPAHAREPQVARAVPAAARAGRHRERRRCVGGRPPAPVWSRGEPGRRSARPRPARVVASRRDHAEAAVKRGSEVATATDRPNTTATREQTASPPATVRPGDFPLALRAIPRGTKSPVRPVLRCAPALRVRAEPRLFGESHRAGTVPSASGNPDDAAPHLDPLRHRPLRLVTHIEELKAELSSLSCPRERRETQAQLKAAQAAIDLHSTEA